MKTEKGVMVIAYKQKNAPRYLVLKRKKNWEGWETPKGRLEDGDYRETVRTELQEEAGIGPGEIEEIEEMEEEVSWSYDRDGEKRQKKYRCFLVKISEDAHVDVSRNPDEEHEKGFFFSFRDAHGMLTHENNRELLEKAADQIREK